MKYLVAILALLCLPAHAETVIGLHTVSIHAPQRAQQNENAGLYIRSASGVEAGAYRNSVGRNTFYISQEFGLLEGSAGKLGLQVGLATGYQKRCTETSAVYPVHHTQKGEREHDEWVKHTHIDCKGFSRGAITPMAGFTYTPNLSFMGVVPRLQFIPGLKNHSSVVHLTLETSFGR